MKIQRKKFALVLASFVALGHFVWVILVGLGWAQPLMNFVYRLHFMENPHMIDPFNLGRAIELILLATAVAYVAGIVFATIWNSVYKE